MAYNRSTEKANFRALIEADGSDRVQDRLNVIDVFLETKAHITLEELFRLLREKGYDYDPGFIRQCMKRMVDLGFAQRKQFEGQPVRYEHRHLGRHHDHMICTKCGRIEEFSNDELERLQLKISSDRGFYMLQHRMEIYGLCARCLSQREPLMPLAMAKSGERVIVRDVSGGRSARTRLSDMGLRIGDLLEIINNNGTGRLILGRDCTRLAIGRGIARKILVSLTEKKPGAECGEGS